jgi:hypothetical protein
VISRWNHSEEAKDTRLLSFRDEIRLILVEIEVNEDICIHLFRPDLKHHLDPALAYPAIVLRFELLQLIHYQPRGLDDILGVFTLDDSKDVLFEESILLSRDELLKPLLHHRFSSFHPTK